MNHPDIFLGRIHIKDLTLGLFKIEYIMNDTLSTPPKKKPINLID